MTVVGESVTPMGLVKKTATHELKKHAATIHCSNALSLLQRKISNALLYHAHPDMLTKEEHEISIKQLCRLISYRGNNHAAIKDALKGLLSTVIEWNLVNDTTGLEDWTASSILASVSLQGPVCYYAYSPRMKQLLHSPSMFGKVNLFIQSRFKSSYGLALYENCVRYCGLPYTKWFEIDVFRKLMGIPAGHYSIFRDFKRRVLDKSVEEVNTYSDLVVEPEVHREGRKVIKIRFHLKERSKKVRIGNKPTDLVEHSSVLQQQLQNHYGLSSQQIQDVLQNYSEELIQEKMRLIETSKNYQQGKVSNLAGYLLSALKKDYQPAKASIDQPYASQQQKNLQSEKEERMKKEIEAIEKAYGSYRAEVIDKAIEALPDFEKTNFLLRFKQHAAQPIATILQLQRQKYTAETIFQSPAIKAHLRQFALQELGSLANRLLSFDKFIAELPEATQKNWYDWQNHLKEKV